MTRLTYALLGCLVMGCASPTDDEAVFEAETWALDERIYRWCHEPGFDGQEAVEYCHLIDVDDPEQPCPGLAETCRGEVEWVQSAGCNEMGGGSAGSSPTEPTGTQDWEPASCEMPSDMGAMDQLFRWVFAIVIALGVLALLRLLFGLWRRSPAPVDLPPEGPAEVDLAEEEEPELDDVPLLPTDQLLAKATEALAAGRLGEAVLFARAATLRGLARGGRLVLHRARTDREYAADLRGDGAHGDLRQVLTATETHRFGGRPVDPSTAEAAVAAARRILSTMVLLWLCLPTPGWATSRYGPNGDVGLVTLLQEWGHDARWRSEVIAELGEDTDMLVLATCCVSVSEEDWQHLETWVSDGGVLVVAGAHGLDTIPNVTFIGTHPLEVHSELRGVGLPSPRLPGGTERGLESWSGTTLVGTVPSAGPEVEEETWTVVGSTPLGDGIVVVVADDRLLFNGALVWDHNRQFLGELPYVGQAGLGWPLDADPVIEVFTSGGVAQPSPPRAMMQAHLLPVILHLLLLWTIVALWRGMAFAPLRDPVVEGRRAFADHVSALGLRWQRGGHSRVALAALGGLWLQRLGPDALIRAGVKAGRTEEHMRSLIDAIADAEHEPDGPSSPAHHTWMEELWNITKRH